MSATQDILFATDVRGSHSLHPVVGHSPRKTKRPRANWTNAFPEQQRKLHPERSPAGGIKSLSQSESVRMEIYKPIAKLFLAANPWCQGCINRYGAFTPAIESTQVHHSAGRDGLLLFDTRRFFAVCDDCHRWIHANPDRARSLKLLAPAGGWRSV
jgi:hypothetical protein